MRVLGIATIVAAVAASNVNPREVSFEFFVGLNKIDLVI
jgi:hypothetical protein